MLCPSPVILTIDIDVGYLSEDALEAAIVIRSAQTMQLPHPMLTDCSDMWWLAAATLVICLLERDLIGAPENASWLSIFTIREGNIRQVMP